MLLSAAEGNYNAIIRHNFREIIHYLLFVAFATAVILCNPSLYWLTNAQQTELIDTEFSTMIGTYTSFDQIRNLEGVWHFIEKVFSHSFEWNKWYDDSGYKLENKLLGVVRLRQLRVKANSCDIFKTFRPIFKSCYGDYSSSNEDTNSFGLKNSSAWIHHSHADLEGTTYAGIVATYDGSGYYQDLHLDETENQKIIRTLKTNLWLSRQSRALFIDLVIYNGNVNLFCIIKIVFELPPTGGVVASNNIDTVKLIQYSNYFEFFILSCKLICLCFLIYYSVILINHLKRTRLKYFTTIWNYLDVIIIVTGYLNIILETYVFILANGKITKLQNNPASYESFEAIVFWHKHLDNSSGLMLFILWIKLFKYVKLNRTLGQLNATASKCAFSMSGFLLTFAVFFIAYATLGFLLFGSHVERFSTFGKTVLSLLMTILGDFDYYEIEKSNKILAPVFFITYIFFVFFVLFNMFLAIITDTYSEVKDEIYLKKSELEIIDFMKRAPRNIARKLHVNISDTRKKLPGNEMIDNIRQIIEICKFSDLEIHIFFSMYNIDENEQISDNTIKKFLSDLKQIKNGDIVEPKRKAKTGQQAVTIDSFMEQQLRLDKLETQLKILGTKIDDLLQE
ncbi:Polycystic kidney disease 2 [Carabus blaptoides fortunei]